MVVGFSWVNRHGVDVDVNVEEVGTGRKREGEGASMKMKMNWGDPGSWYLLSFFYM